MAEAATTEAGAATTEVGTIIIGGSQYLPISLFIFWNKLITKLGFEWDIGIEKRGGDLVDYSNSGLTDEILQIHDLS
jgi:hypothetical protein